MIMLKLELGRKRVLHEMVFDLGSRALRTSTFAATRQLVARVGRNTDLVVFEHERLQRGGLVGPYQDPTEKFARTRREETVGRLGAHLVTYRDWQKLLAAAACRVYQPGDRVLQPGDTVSCLFHVAQGGVRVLDTQSSATEVDEEKALAEYKARAEDEVMDWVQETMVQNKVAELERAEWGVEGMKEDVDIEAGSSHSGSESDDTESDEEEEPKEVEDKAAGMVSASGVTLGLIRKGDVFGVVPFLLNYDPQASMPKTNFAFEVTQPDTVIFSLDADILKNNLLGSKKEVTAAWFKYLAVILGERVEFAEDAMFSQHLHDHSQAELRKEEELLEEKRRAEEAAGFVLDADHSPVTIQDIFGFSVTEELHKEFASEFFTYEKRNNIRTELRLKGTLYLTDHYVAFFGGPAKLMSSTKHKVVIPFEEIVFLKNEKQRAILVCDQMLEKKLIVLKTSEAREEVMRFLMKKWRREDMETGAQARALLRRRITMLTNNQLEFVESSIKGTAHSVLSEMSEKDKRGLFMGTIPIAMQRNQVVIQEDMGNSTLYLLQAGVVRIQRLREHVGGETGTGRAAEKVVFHEINAGEMFGFDSFLTGESSSSSYLVDSEKAIIRCCTKQQIMERLKEDKRLASKFYRVAAVSLALRLAEISPLDVLF
uniref:Cyclic nucleotide-binding domain-containing protein n=1 Tax=Heterosigma akashiwo TaxID=2829 RepID=A0A7S3UPK2_HETAK